MAAACRLKILVDADLVPREKRGAWAYYRAAPHALAALAAVFTTRR